MVQMLDVTLLDIIKQIAPRIAASSNTHAMWVEGSWATGRNHAESDIDVWIDVDDHAFESSVAEFRAALRTIGEIDLERSKGIYSESPRLYKHTFHLVGFPEPQRIELDLQEHSRGFIFDHNEHAIIVIFDKDNTIRWKEE